MIFGDNERREKLGMTTPVTSKYVEGDTRVAFIMPITRTASSLPAPVDDRITEVPPRRVAVLAFRGGRREALVDQKQAELRRLVTEAGLAAKGEPTPWTLPFIRRNEVWIELV